MSLTAHATLTGVEGRLADWRPLEARLARVPGVVAASPYIEEQGMVAHAGKSAGMLLRGIVPADEAEVADLAAHLESGRLEDLAPGKLQGDSRP